MRNEKVPTEKNIHSKIKSGTTCCNRCYNSILQILVAFKMLDGMSKNIANDLNGMSMITKIDQVKTVS